MASCACIKNTKELKLAAILKVLKGTKAITNVSKIRTLRGAENKFSWAEGPNDAPVLQKSSLEN